MAASAIKISQQKTGKILTPYKKIYASIYLQVALISCPVDEDMRGLKWNKLHYFN